MTANQFLCNLLERAGIPTTLTTAEAAAALNRKPQTLNKWAFTKTGPVQPIRVNGRLAWPADRIAALLTGGANA
jgi:hypothetical protein